MTSLNMSAIASEGELGLEGRPFRRLFTGCGTNHRKLMKPAKAAGKTPAEAASSEANNASRWASTRSTFEQALCAAHELLLGHCNVSSSW